MLKVCQHHLFVSTIIIGLTKQNVNYSNMCRKYSHMLETIFFLLPLRKIQGATNLNLQQLPLLLLTCFFFITTKFVIPYDDSERVFMEVQAKRSKMSKKPSLVWKHSVFVLFCL